VFGALADPTRLELLRRMADEPQAVKSLAADLLVSRSAVSQHLRVLREAGLVDLLPRGREIHYALRPGALGSVYEWVARYRVFEAQRVTASSGERPHLRVGSVEVPVRDHDASIRFYVDALDCEVVNDRRFERFRWVSLAPPDGSCVLALVAAPDPAPGRGIWTGVRLITDRIEETAARMIARGVSFNHPPRAQAWGGKSAGFADLDGNRFELVQLP
jgi:DNA-binding transcriptional ArsR family regulator